MGQEAEIRKFVETEKKKKSCNDCSHVEVCRTYSEIEDIILSSSHIFLNKRELLFEALSEICTSF